MWRNPRSAYFHVVCQGVPVTIRVVASPPAGGPTWTSACPIGSYQWTPSGRPSTPQGRDVELEGEPATRRTRRAEQPRAGERRIRPCERGRRRPTDGAAERARRRSTTAGEAANTGRRGPRSRAHRWSATCSAARSSGAQAGTSCTATAIGRRRIRRSPGSRAGGRSGGRRTAAARTSTSSAGGRGGRCHRGPSPVSLAREIALQPVLPRRPQRYVRSDRRATLRTTTRRSGSSMR